QTFSVAVLAAGIVGCSYQASTHSAVATLQMARAPLSHRGQKDVLIAAEALLGADAQLGITPPLDEVRPAASKYVRDLLHAIATAQWLNTPDDASKGSGSPQDNAWR